MELVPKEQTAKTPKRLFIQTYGCQMNVYDSERMKDVLAPLGYAPVDSPEGADLVVLNTCHIRERATEKVYSEIGRLKAHKEAKAAAGDGPMTIAIAGCVAQAEGAEIMRRAPTVDIVVGPQAYHKLPELVAQAARATGQTLDTSFAVEEKFDSLPQERHADGPSAFLSVQEGCDKFCTFCVVPYTRGAEFSRPVDAIVAEARSLAGQGVRELNLLGQNVNAYHGASPTLDSPGVWGLAPLIRHLAKIGGIDRIRYTTSHPRDMNQALIEAHGDTEELQPFLHLPVQSGSDSILRAMNRRHTVADYLNTIDKLRAVRADLAFASDFIVGFPGESDADFEATLDLIRAVGFAQSYSFKYSRRPGTPAAEMFGQVPESVKEERLARLQVLIGEQQRAFNASKMGQIVPVLVTVKGRNHGQVIGRTPYQQSVHFHGPDSLIGTIIDVKIVATAQNSVTGELASVARKCVA